MKVLCVGRNYARHAREMGVPPAEAPLWFWKPDSSIVGDGEAVVLPPGVGEVHHEVELAVRVGTEGRRIDAEAALRHLDGMTVAVDVTARDLQAAAKKAGQPWSQSKGYDTFCPLGAWHPIDRDLQSLQLRLALDGKVRQQGSTAEMTWTVADLLARASQWTTLRPGDVLLTGTPEGVGPLLPGQQMLAEVVGVARLRNPIVAG
ncbi:MAG TPA: fumarylacetoacetate hydrolase family protein [Candidatus Thermoplasmatota archaeon]|nr:fumarylacetoacetate hydrolase family protein [Candidatus Thermoplasmatota archaeon]